MQDLISQLGIDWKSLLSQAVNFSLLLIALRIFVYKPVLGILKERRAKIEGGLVKAKEADERLSQVEEIGKERLKKADGEALGILRRAEEEAKVAEAKLLNEAKQKEAEALKRTEVLLLAKEEESRRRAEEGAVRLVKDAIIKTVGLSPDKIEDELIKRAVKEAGKAK